MWFAAPSYVSKVQITNRLQVFREVLVLAHGDGPTAEENKEGWRRRVSKPFYEVWSNLSVYFRDAAPPKTKSMLRKGSESLRPKRRVHFTPRAQRFRARGSRGCAKKDGCKIALLSGDDSRGDRGERTHPRNGCVRGRRVSVSTPNFRKAGRRRKQSFRKKLQKPCKRVLKGTCTNPLWDSWHPPVCQNYTSLVGSKFGEKCSCTRRRTDSRRKQRRVEEKWQSPLFGVQGNWVVYLKVESRRKSSRFHGRARGVFDLRKMPYIPQKYGEENHHSEWFNPFILKSAAFSRSNFEEKAQQDTLAKEWWARKEALEEMCTKLEETSIRKEPNSHHRRKFHVFRRHPQLNQRKESLSWIQGLHAHVEQKRFVNSRNCESIQQPYKGHHVKWWSANERGRHSARQRFGFICESTAPRGHTARSIAWATLRGSWIFLRVDRWLKSALKNDIQIACNTENYVPTVDPGLSNGSWSSSACGTPVNCVFNRRTRSESSLRQRPVKKDRNRIDDGLEETRSRPLSQKRMTTWHEETRCVICQSGWRRPRKMWWTEKLQSLRQPALGRRVFQNKTECEKHHVFTPFPKDRNRGVSRKTKLQGVLAENAPVIEYHAPKMLLTW